VITEDTHNFEWEGACLESLCLPNGSKNDRRNAFFFEGLPRREYSNKNRGEITGLIGEGLNKVSL